jgi:hypothetical protein
MHVKTESPERMVAIRLLGCLITAPVADKGLTSRKLSLTLWEIPVEVTTR